MVAEIDEATLMVKRQQPLQTVFPGIPKITSAFRYIDGNVYFLDKKNYYKFNEFKDTLLQANTFDLSIVNVICPRENILNRLWDLLNRLSTMSNVFCECH